MKKIFIHITKFFYKLNKEIGFLFTLGGQSTDYKKTIVNPNEMQKKSWDQAISSINNTIQKK